MAAGEISQRGAAEDLPDAFLSFGEQGAQGAAPAVFATEVIVEAALEGDWAFDGLDDLEGGDLGGRPGEAEAATGSAGRLHDAGLGEALEDLSEETVGNVFLGAERLDHDDLTQWTAGKGGEAQDSVLCCAGDLHVLGRYLVQTGLIRSGIVGRTYSGSRNRQMLFQTNLVWFAKCA